eukprot:502543_1
MSAPGYDDPPAYEFDDTSGQIVEAQHDSNPSAPPAYNEIQNEPGNINEGTKTDNNNSIPRRPSASHPPRTIYVVKMANEPTPIITVITPDLIPQYQNEHIVYPKNQNETSTIQVIQPNVLTSNTVSLFTTRVKTQPQRAFITELATKKPLYNDPPPSYDTDNTNIHTNNSSKTMIAHHPDSTNFNICGSSNIINYNKRIPTEIPNKYNLMYGRINLLILLMLWVIFIMIQIDNERTAVIIEYCHTQYKDLSDGYYSWSCTPTATDYIGCNEDPVCFVMDDVYEALNCFIEWNDCQCCADTGIANSGGIYSIHIAFYVFLGINTFRLLILTFAFGLGSIGKAKNSLYITDSNTNKVKLQEYMNYLCDHPSSYLIGLFYSQAGKAITDGIIYNIAFPSTKFLYLNIILLYIPFFTLISIIISAQINILDTTIEEPIIYHTPSPTNIYGYAAPTMYPTYPTYSPTPYPTYPTYSPSITTARPTYYWETTTTTKAPVNYELKSDLLITCIVGLVLLAIGFIMHIYRWRKKNIIERENLKIKAEAEDKEIVVGDQSDSNQSIPVCGFKRLDENARIPADTPKKFNLVFRWINLIIFVYVWVLFGIGMSEYGWFVGDYGACIAYIVFMAFNTMRLMGITVMAGIKHVDNEYNYIINNDTGKVKLRYFMDYLCDHPAGFIIGFLYPDVQKALNEGLMYNITFPEVPFLFANIMMFYLPIMIISSVQASHEWISIYDDLAMLYTIAAIGCGVGIASNAWRFKMKNDIETANVNR